jgi:hypothetical protein
MQELVGSEDESLPALHQVLFCMHISKIKILYQQCTSLVTRKKNFLKYTSTTLFFSLLELSSYGKD